MRRYTRALATTALALLVLSGCRGAPDAVVDADPALWVVKDDDTTIYLFGSVHLLKPGLSWFDEAVKDAFDRSDTLVLEVVLPPEREMAGIVQELGTISNGLSLPERLSPADAKLLQETLPTIGIPANALDQSEPWLAATMIASLPLQKAGYKKEDGVEAVLTRAANAAGKPIKGLETARQQLGYFDGLPEADQRDMLIRTLRGLPTATQTLDQAITAWSEGDPDRIAAMINADVATSPALASALLYQRNARWAEWIKQRMDMPGTVFVTVGAGHLAGDGDLQSELAKRGLQVERVEY